MTLGVELTDSSSKMLELGTRITSVAQMRTELWRFKVRDPECEIARVNYSDSVNDSDCYIITSGTTSTSSTSGTSSTSSTGST